MSIQHSRLGWRPDLPDHRDLRYSAVYRVGAQPLPDMVDLTSKCPEVYDQKTLGSCHDGQTEALTETGWKLFSDLAMDDRLATVDHATGRLIFEKPTRIVSHRHIGDIYKMERWTLDFSVTPDHTMLVRKWNERERTLESGYGFVQMKDVGWYAGLMNHVDYRGTVPDSDVYVLKGVEHKNRPQREDMAIPMDSWLKFLGIYIAEGTMLRAKASYRSRSSGGTAVVEAPARTKFKIQIAAGTDLKKKFIRQTLAEIGIRATERPDRFTFENKRIYSAMTKLGLRGVKAPQKFVPEFIFAMSAEKIESFLLGHLTGDGNNYRGTLSHYTSSERLANDLQRLILLAGGWGTLSSRERPASRTTDGRIIVGRYPEYRVSRWKSRNLSICRKAQVSTEHFDGMVYCAEVPTYHTLVTRRNGTMLISGNCTANAGGALGQFLHMKEGIHNWVPSRLWLYWNARQLIGETDVDNGATLRDMMKVLAGRGMPPESLWWYDTAKFAVKPNKHVYDAALPHKVTQYLRLDNSNVNDLLQCLADGFPLVGGFSVYDSFMSDEVARTGNVPMPSKTDTMVGGHAVLVVGYNRTAKLFICRNSWGKGWGLQGYFHMPFDYFTNTDLADDFWTARLIA